MHLDNTYTLVYNCTQKWGKSCTKTFNPIIYSYISLTIKVYNILYFSEKKLKKSDDCLKFWRKRESKYPNLGILAKKYLSFTATSTPAERVFSNLGNIMTKKRLSLEPDMVNKIIFLHDKLNIWAITPWSILLHSVQKKWLILI